MSGFKPDQKAWDKVFLIAVDILFIAWLVLMPLDAVRFHWSHMPVWLQIAGATALLCSFYAFYLIARENPFLSPLVRHSERSRADGGVDRAVSICAPSNVLQRAIFVSGNGFPAGVVVRCPCGADLRGTVRISGSDGGTRIKAGT